MLNNSNNEYYYTLIIIIKIYYLKIKQVKSSAIYGAQKLVKEKSPS